MLTNRGDPPASSLQIVQDEKFYSRLLSRQTSAANNSCRVYYGVAPGAVPFLWESQPGTPKNPISSTALPPLTPPPSYLFKPKKNPSKRHSKSNLFLTMLPKLNFRRSQFSSSPPSSISSSLSSSWSIPSSPVPSSSSRSLNYHARSRFSSPSSSFSSRGDEEDLDQSPTSTLCFGVVGRESSTRLRGCYSMVIMKNALSSIIRSHGSAQGTS
ncbi:pectinesterase inhibitor 10-like [Aristolochia californica]|uniref:pectinesterase inhibitor 10-like n=1 Tax=Aristolochia californica TaxID=171875 RepID=UPI0035E10FF9